MRKFKIGDNVISITCDDSHRGEIGIVVAIQDNDTYQIDWGSKMDLCHISALTLYGPNGRNLEKPKTLTDELLDAIDELYTRYWEQDLNDVSGVAFEIAEVHTLARLIKQERKNA